MPDFKGGNNLTFLWGQSEFLSFCSTISENKKGLAIDVCYRLVTTPCTFYFLSIP